MNKSRAGEETADAAGPSTARWSRSAAGRWCAPHHEPPVADDLTYVGESE